MSETRKLGFDPDLGLTENPTINNAAVVTEPAEVEVVELLIAVVTSGEVDWDLPEVPRDGLVSVGDARNTVLLDLAYWRAAMARDTATKEQERAEEERVEALAGELERAWHENSDPRTVAGGYASMARRAYELGARAPQGEGADRG